VSEFLFNADEYPWCVSGYGTIEIAELSAEGEMLRGRLNTLYHRELASIHSLNEIDL
jgi:hypothetical protein